MGRLGVGVRYSSVIEPSLGAPDGEKESPCDA